MIEVGSLIEHPQKPEWGPGKGVHMRGDTLYVFFRDLPGERARKFRADASRLTVAQSDPVLENLPPFKERGGELVIPEGRVTVAEARARFLRIYPGGFHDPAYLGSETEGERTYKWSAHQRVIGAFGGGLGRELLAANERVVVTIPHGGARPTRVLRHSLFGSRAEA